MIKKLLLAFLIICPIMSYGQVKSSSETIRYITLCKFTNTMELQYYEPTENYSISFLSTNQFDSRAYISLGEYKDALSSLDFFINTMETLQKGESIKVEVGSETILFISEKYFGKCLAFRTRGQAGFSYMHKSGLEKFKPVVIEYQHILDSLKTK